MSKVTMIIPMFSFETYTPIIFRLYAICLFKTNLYLTVTISKREECLCLVSIKTHRGKYSLIESHCTFLPSVAFCDENVIDCLLSRRIEGVE